MLKQNRPYNLQGLNSLSYPMLHIPSVVNNTIGSQLYSDLIAGWEFGANSGSIGTDIKNVHNATYINRVTKENISAIESQSLGFTGSNASIVIPYNPLLNFQGKSFSLITLFKYKAIYLSSDQQFNSFFSKDFQNANKRTFRFDSYTYNGEIWLYFAIGDGGNHPRFFYNAIYKSITDTDWHLLIGEYKYDSTLANTKIRLYLDNLLLQEKTPEYFLGDNTDFYSLASRHLTATPSSAITPNFITYSTNQQYLYILHRETTQEERDYLWNNGLFTYLPKP